MQERESSFSSCCFVIPKKESGLRLILDLRLISRVLHKCAFRMSTLKQSLTQIRSRDWFISEDLRDAYFYIQIAPPPQAFSEICVWRRCIPVHDTSIQAGSRNVDAALSPLRASGMRILIYLDDWLI